MIEAVIVIAAALAIEFVVAIEVATVVEVAIAIESVVRPGRPRYAVRVVPHGCLYTRCGHRAW